MEVQWSGMGRPLKNTIATTNKPEELIKVEPQRWYYWCDKLGILVWQDMPSTFKQRSEEEKMQFELELQRMVKTQWNHPSIINWIVFNEHWGDGWKLPAI